MQKCTIAFFYKDDDLHMTGKSKFCDQQVLVSASASALIERRMNGSISLSYNTCSGNSLRNEET